MEVEATLEFVMDVSDKAVMMVIPIFCGILCVNSLMDRIHPFCLVRILTMVKRLMTRVINRIIRTIVAG